MDLREKRPPKDFFKLSVSKSKEQQVKRKRQAVTTKSNTKRQLTINTKASKKRQAAVNTKIQNKDQETVDIRTNKKSRVTVSTKANKKPRVTVHTKANKEPRVTVNTKANKKPRVTVNTKANKKRQSTVNTKTNKKRQATTANKQQNKKRVERQSRHRFQCKTSYCDGWFEYNSGVIQFLCSTCRHVNCIKCQAVHEGWDCLAYKQLKLNEKKENQTNEATKNESQSIDEKELEFKPASPMDIDTDIEDITLEEKSVVHEKSEHLLLLELENSDGPVPNPCMFNCPICYLDVGPQEGIILRECLHCLCTDCFTNSVKYSDEPEVKCPLEECEGVFQHREMKAVVPTELFEAHMSKIYKQVESQTKNSFHCQTANCDGWSEYDEGVREFLCPICKYRNCISCQAVHEGVNCMTFQQSKLNNHQENKSIEALQEQIEKGEAMKCPGCQMIVTKNGGCDGMVCWVCRTELCWATKGARWGPQGRGDVSGGCHCNENGRKCHPKCKNCH